MSQTDAELVHATLLGNTEAYNQLVQRHVHKIHRAVIGQVSDFSIAEDITQEAFAKGHSNLTRLQKPENFGVWLHRIAMNIAVTRTQKGIEDIRSLSINSELRS